LGWICTGASGARGDGPIVSLPENALLFNLQPRLRGLHPVGERDLQHQSLYVGADPAALGCLLQVAARVRSAPLDVTRLVRHKEYQQALLRTNPNAADGRVTRVHRHCRMPEAPGDSRQQPAALRSVTRVTTVSC
jgi:hypothetical protein